MRRPLLYVLLGGSAIVVVPLAYLAAFPLGQQPDSRFDATVKHPAYVDRHPVVLLDEGHHNAHTATGGYLPFARLLSNDGYTLQRHKGPFTAAALHDASALVIVNAAGGSNPKLFGLNLPFLRRGQRDAPAFTESEIDVVKEWVGGGGSVLLIADHAPFGSAAAAMSSAFGVAMSQGFTEAPGQYEGQPEPGTLEFSRLNALLGAHPMLEGRNPEERINRVRTFTGQSLDAPQATILLQLPPTAVEYVPNEPAPRPAGSAQGVALEYGRGRVVVMGEAAMLTAQTEGDQRWGMNQEGLDNRQLALNVMHWLTRVL